jgi:putative phosphoribosyl transferase
MSTLTHEETVRLSLDDATLEGSLTIPPNAHGIVIFAHGSGSSRHSPRNRYVAGVLNQHDFAILLLDLLTAKEERIDEVTRHLRFDVRLLARRLAGAAAWAKNNPDTAALRIGYFGASTGAAAALIAAAEHPEGIGAIVSRGGRPDLAGDALRDVRAPTLLIVGGEDDVVIDLNREAYANLFVEKKVEIIPGATHLFEEPGALEQVARLAADWFERWLPSSA